MGYIGLFCLAWQNRNKTLQAHRICEVDEWFGASVVTSFHQMLQVILGVGDRGWNFCFAITDPNSLPASLAQQNTQKWREHGNHEEATSPSKRRLAPESVYS